ncbi:MAG: hypothetical protein LBE20_05360 [Deltaproteobacteria bacterium]|jgi:hypothetical protein|nr:hypothetical protein [Deltaproteobacteria bacterium]
MDKKNGYTTRKLPPSINVVTYTDSRYFKLLHSEDLSPVVLDDIINELEELNLKLRSFFQRPKGIIFIFIFPDQETYHLFSFEKQMPRWFLGSGSYGEVKVIDPSFADKLGRTYEFMIQTVKHELVHVFTCFEKNKATLFYEGVATYFAGQKFLPEINSWMSDTNKDLTKIFYTDYENAEFPKAGGYIFSYTVIEYIIDKYGEDKLQEYFLSQDIEPYNILKVKKDDFISNWKEWLLKTYGGDA